MLEKGGEVNSENNSGRGWATCRVRDRLRDPQAQGTGEVGWDTQGAAGEAEAAEEAEMVQGKDRLNHEENQVPPVRLRVGFQGSQTEGVPEVQAEAGLRAAARKGY
ncbi:unnamed protein product [marine sediment metagenome]|uniref:Uncharacterized protein n=1 Tax=marine sediment metagenome TaxID=412755 RepID=X1N0D7_9ZZZZ